MSFSQMFHRNRKYYQASLVMAAALSIVPRVASGAITPSISSISDPVIVGGTLTISGSGFTAGSVANLFVSTATVAVNFGPLAPSAQSSTSLTIPVSTGIVTTLGEGVVSVVVVNVDQGYTQSNFVTAQLLGDTRAGFPNLLKINGVGLAATSTDPSYATDNVETAVMQGHKVTLGGMGFDTARGVAIDLFCDCPGGKMPTVFLNPGDPGLTSTALSFTLPGSAVSGPGSFVISNKGAAQDYAIKSNAVSVAIGAAVTVNSVKQTGCEIAVDGSGFALTGSGLPPSTVINLFNRQGRGVANLGGLTAAGDPRIALNITSAKRMTFSLAGVGILPGASYVQVLNPPFIPFASSGNSPSGALTSAGCAPWPMFHQNPRHTGQSPFSTAGDTGVMKWQFATGYSVVSSPVVSADGTIYVGTHSAGTRGFGPDRTPKFKFPSGPVLGSPAVGLEGTIYVGSQDGYMYAVNPNNHLKWKFKAGAAVPSSPALGADGTIYIGADNYNVYAVNPDGSQKWKFSTGNLVVSSPAIGADGTIYVSSFDQNLYALNPDGSQKWKFATGGLLYSSPAIGADGTVYVGSADDNLYAVNPDGSQKWRFDAGSYVDPSPAVAEDGTVYVGSADGNLYAVNPDGTQKWKFTTGNHVISSPALSKEGTIFFGSDDNNLYAVNPDGTQKWKFTTRGQVNSSPAIGPDGTVYVGSNDGSLYAIH